MSLTEFELIQSCLQNTNILEDFSLALRNVVRTKAGFARTSVLEIKAALWAVGHIGSSEHGATWLKSCGLVKTVVDIAETASVLGIRGQVTSYLFIYS